MKILFLTHQGDLAGSTNSISYLSSGLAERGHEVYVGCRRESLLFEILKDSKATTIPMTFKGRFDLSNMRQIKQVVQDHGIQIINAQSSLDRYTSGFAKWLFRLPVILIHTRRQMPKSTGLFVQNWFYAASTELIVAVSQGVKEALIELGLPEDHISVIKNGTPREKYQLKTPELTNELRKKHNLPSDAKVIGCVSRRKNQEQLLKAYSELSIEAWLVFVGIEEDDVLREVELTKEQKSRVVYTGMVPREEVLYYHGLFTLEVLPSIMEGLSQSLLEAMALGIPVIATNAAGNPDLIMHQKNGLLFEDGNITMLAAYIEKIISDDTLYELFKTNGQKTALEDFEIGHVLDNYEQLFENEIEKRDR